MSGMAMTGGRTFTNRHLCGLVLSSWLSLMSGTAVHAVERGDVAGIPDPLDRIDAFEQHRGKLESGGVDDGLFALYQRVGRAYYQTGNSIIAGQLLRSALGLSERLTVSDQQLAQLYNDLGLVSVARSDLDRAMTYFGQSLELARKSADRPLEVVSGVNAARTVLGLGEVHSLDTRLEHLSVALDGMDQGTEYATHALEIGELYRRAVGRGALGKEGRLEALALYQRALQISLQISARGLESRALGSLGQLYEDERQVNHALDYTRRASFAAQQIGDDVLLYRWQWQLARLLRMGGDIEAALDAYRDAVATLTRARPQLLNAVSINHRQEISPVYYELADLLLTRSGEAEARREEIGRAHV